MRSHRRRRHPRVLEVVDVSVSFDAVDALAGVSLSVADGQFVGLIGPNGAGKTTLFNVVSGFVRPGGGRVRYCGRRVTDWPPQLRARAGIARTFQSVGLDKQATVRDNLLLAAEPGDIAATLRSIVQRRREGIDALPAGCQELVEGLGLTPALDEVVGVLPAGTAKLVELACAAASSPRLLLLDEPSSGLGPGERADLADALGIVRRAAGVSVLMIEHDMRLAMSLSDYVYVLNFGTLLAEGTPDEIRTDERVIDAYLGRTSR